MATYRAQGTDTFALTVTGGAGGGTYLPGTVVNISANAPVSGSVFDKWVGNTANVENVNLPNTTIQMPFSATTVVATYKTQGGSSLLTVTKGTGDGNYLPGTVVNISADAPDANYVFDKWAGDTGNITNINLPDTTIVMPFLATTVVATYKTQGANTYLLTVTGGAGGGPYLPGAVVNISANVAPANQVFDKWVGQTDHVANINLPNTTIIMPFLATTVVATYRAQGTDTFALTVTGGAGGGNYLPGAVVNISANAPASGSVFDKWVGNTANVENINLPNTTIQMPFSATTIVAAYKTQGGSSFALTVTKGTGDGNYLPGTVVNISADAPDANYVFDKWAGDTANIININLPDTTIVMPSRAAAVTATYKAQGGAEYTLTVTNGTGGGTYPPGTVIGIAADVPVATLVFDKC